MRLDPGMFAFLDGAGVFATQKGHGWVSDSVLMLECIAVLLSDGNITLSDSVPIPLGPGLYDDTAFVPVAEEGNVGRQQMLLEWLSTNADQYGRARVEKLIAVSS